MKGNENTEQPDQGAMTSSKFRKMDEASLIVYDSI